MSDSNIDYSDWYSWIEKRVCAKDNLYGTLKYFGNTNFSDGLWCGIELDNPLGKNDGTVNNIRYFTCNSNFGIFIPVSKVTKVNETFEDNLESIANLNKTFKIENSFAEQNYENPELLDGGNKQMKSRDKKLSNSGLGSTESLGILSLDLIDCDNSWDDFKLNCSLDNEFSNPENVKDNTNCFLEPAAVSEKNFFCDTIADPKYASTPRVSKKKLVGHGIDLDDSLDAKNFVSDKFNLDTHFQETSEFFFDVDKLNNNPNLTSTYKNLSELTAMLNNPEISPILTGNKNIHLEKTKNFSNEKFSQNNNEILSKTFELQNTTLSPTLCGKEYNFFNKNELNATTIIEDINSRKSNNSENVFNEKLDAASEKRNADATFELPVNVSLKLSLEETKDLTFDLKETENLNKFDTINKNEFNVTIIKENLKSANSNGNATFELESPIQVHQKIPEETKEKNFHSKENEIKDLSNFSEFEVMTDVTNKNELLLEKTFVFDLSTINEYEEINKQDESFKYKSEFLKETDSFQNSNIQLNYRNSICLPPSLCNKLQISARRTSSVSDYPSSKPTKETEYKSFSNRGSISSLKDLCGKTNVFKKPFSPNLNLKSSKVALKSQSSINSKENRNVNKKANVNTECSENETAFKSKLIKPSFNKDNSVEFSKHKSYTSKNCSSKTISNPALAPKNKLKCDNFKKPSNIASKIYSKTMSVDKIIKKNITQTQAIATQYISEDSVKDHVIKNSKKLKTQSLDNTFISKSDCCNSLQKTNSPSINSKLRIPKRNSLVPCFKDKLPVGVIKPRYSMCPAKSDAILENVEIKKDRFSQIPEKNLAKINHSNDGKNKPQSGCSAVKSSKNGSSIKQPTALPKKIKNQLQSPSNIKPGLKQPLKKIVVPSGLKIPGFSKT